MNNYLIDRETLGKFVDELIKKKPLPVNTPEELNALRENAIQSLDERIGMAVFGKLSDEQNAAFNQMLDRGDATEEDFQKFFDDAGVNIDQSISDAMNAFREEFLGGQNA